MTDSNLLTSCRDIKPENFLLKNKEDISNVKMIDFGLSKDYSEIQVMQTPSGSVSHTKPYLPYFTADIRFCHAAQIIYNSL
jgi:serine/threonine protein kinase